MPTLLKCMVTSEHNHDAAKKICELKLFQTPAETPSQGPNLPNLETSGLKIVLWIAMISLGLEIIMMFHKNHFYTLLSECSVLSIFFLNYFDSTFIKIVIGNLLLSSVLDMIWEITNARVFLYLC